MPPGSQKLPSRMNAPHNAELFPAPFAYLPKLCQPHLECGCLRPSMALPQSAYKDRQFIAVIGDEVDSFIP